MGYLLKGNFIVLQLLRDEEGWRDKATKLWLRWRVFTYPGLSRGDDGTENVSSAGKEYGHT